MKTLFAVALLLTPFGSVFAQDGKAIRNVKVKEALRKYHAEQQRLEELYIQALAKARKSCEDKLDVALQDIMSAGNLEEANAVAAVRESLNVKQAEQPKQPVAHSVNKTDQLREKLENTTWQRPDGTWVQFLPDGVLKKDNGQVRWVAIDHDKILSLQEESIFVWQFAPKMDRVILWNVAMTKATKAGQPHTTFFPRN